MRDTPHLPSGCSHTEEGGCGGGMGEAQKLLHHREMGTLIEMSKVLSAQRRGPKLSRESGQGRLPGGRRHT